MRGAPLLFMLVFALAGTAGTASQPSVPVAPAAAPAADAVRSWYGLIGARRYREAYWLLADGVPARAAGERAFARSFARYARIRAEIDGPSEVEGAAGSSFANVPLTLSGRLRSGTAFRRRAVAQLRRCNDVPG